MLLKVGVTGGIGSGKSTICRIFETINIPVYYADVRARELIEGDDRLIEGYQFLFGPDAYINGRLNKNFVAEKIFTNKALLQKVNSLVHPVVYEDFEKWMHRQDSPYVIKEAAVLLEAGGHKMLDKVVLVSAPEELRISRVAARDKVKREQVMERIHNQWSDERRRPFCDYEIVADDQHLLVPQVLNIHKELLK
jgi:dephospho-CoA kinase